MVRAISVVVYDPANKSVGQTYPPGSVYMPERRQRKHIPNIDGLNRADRERIAAIGFEAWLDEVATTQPAATKPSLTGYIDRHIGDVDALATLLDKIIVADNLNHSDPDYPAKKARRLRRMAQKLQWSFAHGWRPLPQSEVEGVMLFAELTPDEHRMTDSQFERHLTVTRPKRVVVPKVKDTILRSNRPCRLGRYCMNATGRKPAMALPRKKYCSEACEGRAAFMRQHPSVDMSKIAGVE